MDFELGRENNHAFAIAIAFIVSLTIVISFDLVDFSGAYITIQNANIAPVTSFTVEPNSVSLPDAAIGKTTLSVQNRRFIWHQYYIIVPSGSSYAFEMHEFTPLAQTAKGTGWILDSATANIDLDRTKILSSNNFAFVYSCALAGTAYECNERKWGYREFFVKAVDYSVDITQPESGTLETPTDVTVTVTTNNPDAKSLDPFFDLVIEWDSGQTTSNVALTDSASTAITLTNGVSREKINLANFVGGKVVKNYKVKYSGSARNAAIKASLDFGLEGKPNIEEINSNNNIATKQIALGIPIPPVNYIVGDAVLGTINGGTATISIPLSRTGGPTDDQNDLSLLLDFDSPNKNAQVENVAYGTTQLTKNTDGYYTYKNKMASKITDTPSFTVTYKTAKSYSIQSKIENADTTASDNEKTTTDKVVMNNYVISTITGGTADIMGSVNVIVGTSRTGSTTDNTERSVLVDFDSTNKNTNVESITYNGEAYTQKNADGLYEIKQTFGTRTSSNLIFTVTYKNPGSYNVLSKFSVADFTLGDNEKTVAAVTITGIPTAPQTLTAPNTCSNGKLDTTETDIDCGGTCTGKCTVSQKCLAVADCISGFCVSSVCSSSATGSQIGDVMSGTKTGLLAYYKFEDNANDENTIYNGVVQNGATYTTGLAGKTIILDGLNDYVEVASKEELKYKGGDMTLSTWIYIDPGETDGSRIISKPWNGQGEYNYMITYASDGRISLELKGGLPYFLTAQKILTKSQWHHISATVNSNKEVKIYINGVQEASETHTIINWIPISGDLNLPLAIGTLYPYGNTWTGDGTHAFKGKIDETKIYNKALTSAEVAAEYSAYSTSFTPITFTPITAGLVSEWKFDEGTGTLSASTPATGSKVITLKNMGTNPWINGRITGKALNFEGGGSLSTQMTTTLPAFTFDAWIKPGTTSEQMELISKRSVCAVSTNDMPFALVLDKDGTIASCLVDSGGNWATDLSVTSVTFTPNQWHHLTCSYDTGVLKISVDGVSQTATKTVVLSSNTREYTIGTVSFDARVLGGSSCGSSMFYKGGLDSLRIYNRGLSDAEILQNCKADGGCLN